MRPRTHHLLATLGGKPQVITTALDRLLEQGYPIGTLVLFHTSQPGSRVETALAVLVQEFASTGRYPAIFRFQPTPLTDPAGQPLADLITPADIDAGFRTIYRTLLNLKRQEATIHFCPAGGRKTMTLFSMAAAQLLFEEGDRFWHVVAEGPFLESGRLHPEDGDEVAVIPVPLLRWLRLTPALIREEPAEDPRAAFAQRQSQLEELQEKRLAEFLRHWLSPAERQAAELVIREGLDNRAIGLRLGRSASTVANQLTGVYEKLAEFLELPLDQKAQRHMLVATFSAYLQRK